jgi:hypothetical protein
LALDQLEAMDLAFDLSITPLHSQGCRNGLLIAA